MRRRRRGAPGVVKAAGILGAAALIMTLPYLLLVLPFAAVAWVLVASATKRRSPERNGLTRAEYRYAQRVVARGPARADAFERKIAARRHDFHSESGSCS